MRNIHSAPTTFRILLVQEDAGLAQEVIESFSLVALDCHHIVGRDEVPQALTQVNPHLILWDNPSGGRAHLHLRELQSEQRIPVIVLTHEDDAVDTDMLGRGLIEDYVLKPVDPKLLALRVMAHLRAHEPPAKGVRNRGPAEWLPFGWTSCKACGFRGREESFRRSKPPLQVSSEQEHTGEVTCCPRCGQHGGTEQSLYTEHSDGTEQLAGSGALPAAEKLLTEE